MLEWDMIYFERPRTVVGLIIGVGFLLYYFVEVAKKPLLACRQGAWKDFLESHLSILEEKYWPTPWCYESRCQTILASLFRFRLPDLKYRREVLQLKDGGQACLDWLDGDGTNENSPIVLILPGLTGCSQSEYVKGLILSIQGIGVRCVVLNNRGTGGMPLTTTRTYCAANSDDLEAAITHLNTTNPKIPIMAIGISLGGLIIGNYLTTRIEKAAQQLVCAAVLSVPWDMIKGLRNMEEPVWNLMLNRYLAYCMCDLANSLSYKLAGNHKWDLNQVVKSRTIREFDSRFTAKQFGFRDAEDYYTSSTLHDKIHTIRVPLLCLNAADDPFQPLHAIPMEAARKSSHVAIIVTARGGHIGFMEGLFPKSSYYSDRLIGQLVRGVFSSLDGMKLIKKEADEHAGKSDYYAAKSNKC
ncbi:phospholipase ABHD3-like [Macrobrachium rosenbergii]|uniref:phospholipase ABHD3-like n=1 Tax=Macrobrachium rosenbergii TaxID=79674 RepID=UPI0034D556B3